jgi:hypothetical protein
MKISIRIALVILLIFLGGKLPVSAQNYIPMVVKGNTVGFLLPAGWGASYPSFYQIYCDTTIAGKSYKKVYNDHCGYVGALREDLVNRRVYYFGLNAVQEELYIDFMVNIGDTIRWNPPGGGPNRVDTVRAVYQQYLYGANRWVIELNKSFQVKLIEGIGSNITGLVPESCFSYFGNFNSFSNVPNMGCSPGVLGTKEIESSLKIYPNPAKDYLAIEAGEGTTLPTANYRVYNILGSVVQNGELSAQNARIDLRQFKPGIYILVLDVNGKERILKFQVQE